MGDLGVGSTANTTSAPNTVKGNASGSSAPTADLNAAQLINLLGLTIQAVDALPDGTGNIALADIFPFEHDPTNTKVLEKSTFTALKSLIAPATSASIDTTNASNITSGNLPAAQLPTTGLVKILAQSGIPFILAPNGTMANNGAVTLGTALGTTYANAYMYMPAAAIAAGSAAGWYFCQMSSTTVGTLFNNTYTSGTPTIPASPTAFSTTGPGAYTQTTASDITAISIPIAGNSIGVNGGIECSMMSFNNNTAGTKKVAFYFGGSSAGGGSQTTSTASSFMRSIRNRGVTGAQVAINNVFGDASTGSATYMSKDTTASQNVELKPNIATATDYVVIEWFCVKLLPN